MWRLLVLVVVAATAVTSPTAQPRDAASVLADMRQALGGAAVLDAIRTFTLQGTSTRKFDGRGRTIDLEILAILPDHYLEIRRDHGTPGPIDTRVTYFDGFRAGATIRRTDSSMPFPAPPGSDTDEARAARDRVVALSARRTFARLALVLFGRSFEPYPLDFTYVGTADEGGRSYEVIDARGDGDYVLRLAVDRQTHLPAVLSWMGEGEVVMTTTSRMTTRNGEVVNRQDDPPPSIPLGPPPTVVRKLVIADYKLEDGVNWPRTLVETSPVMSHEIKLRRIKLNPKVDSRRFDIR